MERQQGRADGPDRPSSLDFAAMSGPVALIGAGEFLLSMSAFDQGLLEATGRRRPRVAILATGAFAAGEEAFQRATATGLEHFRSLGAEVESVDVRDRASADDPAAAQVVGEADLVYVCDGDAGHLRRSLAGSTVWAAVAAAHERGAILAGSAAGAVVLGERQLDVALRLGWPVQWPEALSIADGLTVLPAYDDRPETMRAVFALQAPRGILVFGIDRETAVVGRDGSWAVHGRGRVTVWDGRRRVRHRSGEIFRGRALPAD